MATNPRKKQNSFEANLIVVSSIIVLVAIISFIAHLIITQETISSQGTLEPDTKTIIRDLDNCLEKDSLDYKCEILFWQYASIENCDKMKTQEKRDECLYTSARITMQDSFCWEINDPILNGECYSKIHPFYNFEEESYG